MRSRELARAVEDNEAEFLLALGRAGRSRERCEGGRPGTPASSTRPSEPAARLETHGFASAREPGMAADLTRVPAIDRVDGLSIERASLDGRGRRRPGPNADG